jgi:hypothetical protein
MGQRFQMRALVPGSGACPGWPGPPEEDAETRGVLVVGRCRPLTGAEEREASMHPSPSMTAMGGQDDAVTRFGRLVSSARCSGSAPRTALSSNRSTRAGSFPLDPPGDSRPPQLPDGRKPDWPGRHPDSRAQSREGGWRGRLFVPVERCRDAFSDHCAKATHGSNHNQKRQRTSVSPGPMQHSRPGWI